MAIKRCCILFSYNLISREFQNVIIPADEGASYNFFDVCSHHLDTYLPTAVTKAARQLHIICLAHKTEYNR